MWFWRGCGVTGWTNFSAISLFLQSLLHNLTTIGAVADGSDNFWIFWTALFVIFVTFFTPAYFDVTNISNCSNITNLSLIIRITIWPPLFKSLPPLNFSNQSIKIILSSSNHQHIHHLKSPGKISHDFVTALGCLEPVSHKVVGVAARSSSSLSPWPASLSSSSSSLSPWSASSPPCSFSKYSSY